MKTFTEFKKSAINEVVSDVVFHATRVKNAIKILQSNVFQLTPIISDEADEVLGAQGSYYMSVTRSVLGDYHNARLSGVIFVMDGRRLNHNFKSKAVDYFNSHKWVNDDEMEDRIFSDRPEMKNADRYIKEIHIHEPDSENIPTLIREADKANIPVWVYANNGKWARLDRRHAVLNPTANDSSNRNTQPQSNDDVYHTDQKMLSYLKLMKSTRVDVKNFTHLDRELLQELMDNGERHTMNSIRNAIDDYTRNSNYPEEFLNLAREFVLQMRRHKARTMRQLADALRDKYSS